VLFGREELAEGEDEQAGVDLPRAEPAEPAVVTVSHAQGWLASQRRHHRASETAMAYRLSAVDQSSAAVVVTLAL
jgi:hypothetical protein